MKLQLELFGVYLTLLLLMNCTNSIHLTGTFNTNDFFLFITRFGMQSTDLHEMHYDTNGYIYGNISLVSVNNLNISLSKGDELPQERLIMLTVMDYNYFIDYYNKRRIVPASVACPMMFENIEKTAYFFECNENGHQDFVRRVPCPANKPCIDEDNHKNLIPGYQFKFKIHDSNQARFWYISLVACTREKCIWHDLNSHSNTTKDQAHISFTVSYDIWIVNGNPASKSNNRFEHHFSFELHDIFEIYLCSFLIYLFVFPFICYRLYLHFHYMYLQLFVYVSIELSSRFFALTHNLIFAYNGRGIFAFQLFADLLEATASSILILILISVAKGWTIRSKHLLLSRQSVILGVLLQLVLVTSHVIGIVRNTI